MLHYFLRVFSSALIKYKPVPATCKAQGLFRTEQGSWESTAPVLRQENQQDSIFLLLKGKRGRGGEKETDSYKTISLFPVKLDFLDVQMSIKGNLKRGNAFLSVTNPWRPGLRGFLVEKLWRVIWSWLVMKEEKISESCWEILLVYGYVVRWAQFTGMRIPEPSFWNGYYRTCSSKYHHVNPDLSSSFPGGSHKCFSSSRYFGRQFRDRGKKRVSWRCRSHWGWLLLYPIRIGSPLFISASDCLFSHCFFCRVPEMTNSNWTDSVTWN